MQQIVRERWSWMGLDIGGRTTRSILCSLQGQVRATEEKEKKASPTTGATYCTLWDGKPDLSLVRPFWFWSECLQIAVFSAVVSNSPSVGRRSQWSHKIVYASNNIISWPSPVPFLPPPSFLCWSSVCFCDNAKSRGCPRGRLKPHLIWEQ